MSTLLGRRLRDQSGVALVALMLAVFILTVVVAGLTLATMGETGLSFDQSRSGQAFQIAEAGAYRALADLRHSMSVYLPANIQVANPRTLKNLCDDNEGWRIITAYGGPGWAEEPAYPRAAILAIGSRASPVRMWDPLTQASVGSFYARVYVRPAVNTTDPPPSPPAYQCGDPGDEVVSYTLPYDYFIVATGVTRNAERSICLKNSGNLTSCAEWLASADPGAPRWDSAPLSHAWVVHIESASYSRWALMLLSSARTWLTDTSVFAGPVHSNTQLQIWGNPTFGSTVTQVDLQVNFGNGGSPIQLMNDENPPTDVPMYLSTRLQRGWCDGSPDCRIDPPVSSSPFWAVLDQRDKSGSPPDTDVCRRTTALPDTCAPAPGPPIPAGVYFMDQCTNATCGGIFVQGNVRNLVLCLPGTPQCPAGPPGANGRQHIIVTTAGSPPEQRMYILESSNTNVRECTGPPTFSTCVDKGKGFNGMLYVNGSILRVGSNPNTGLYGTLQEDTRLTIAADGEIWVTDHLVYESPPNPADPYDPVKNVLGLYAWCSQAPVPCGTPRDVVVAGGLTPRNLNIHASVLVPWGKFYVRNWDSLPDKGMLHFLGGTVQADFGEWGGFLTDPFGRIIGYKGYGRDMVYDQRFLTNTAPPFFPLTKQLNASRENLNPDPLYDRPHWEELTAP